MRRNNLILGIILREKIYQEFIKKKHPIQIFYKMLKDIHEIRKPDRFNEILQALAKVFFDPQYKDLKISFVIDAGKDTEFDKFYEQFLKCKIQTLAENVDLTSLFPTDCVITDDIKHDLRELLKQMFTIDFVEQFDKLII